MCRTRHVVEQPRDCFNIQHFFPTEWQLWLYDIINSTFLYKNLGSRMNQTWSTLIVNTQLKKLISYREIPPIGPV